MHKNVSAFGVVLSSHFVKHLLKEKEKNQGIVFSGCLGDR